MTLVDAVRSGFRNYFRFSGRASRSEYWKFVLFVFLGCIAAIIVNSAIYGPEVINQVMTNIAKDDSATTETQAFYRYSGGLIGNIFVLACLVPLLSVGWRRLHDTGLSGWWLIMPTATTIGIILLILVGTLGFAEVWSSLSTTGRVHVNLGGLSGLAFVITILGMHILLLLRLCRRSDVGPNRYGPNPTEVLS